MTKHIVRLGEIRIASALGDLETAKRLRKSYVEEKKFIYIPYWEEKIVEYETNREKYESFDMFFPGLIQVFSEIEKADIT